MGKRRKCIREKKRRLRVEVEGEAWSEGSKEARKEVL